MTESFFKIKNFESLKEVMEPFLSVRIFLWEKLLDSDGVFFRIKNFKSRKKAAESFFQY